MTLVNEIAKIDFNGKIKNMYSFATKYCSHHKPDIFPIYDSYVEKVLKYYHMINEDLQFKNSDLKDYQSYVNIFSQSIKKVKEVKKMEITNFDITNYLDTVEEERKDDILTLLDIGRSLTQKEPKLWGSIVGFGSLHYKYKTGHEGDMPIFGFANRKQALTLYISYTLEEYEELKVLGKYKIGKSCLYIKRLSDVNLEVLKKLIARGIKDVLELSFITINEE